MSTENENAGAASIAKTLGIIGLVIGIIALIVAFIPCFGVYAMYIGGLGLIISIIAFMQAKKANISNGLIVGALVVSFLATAVGYYQYYRITSAINQVQTELENGLNELQKEIENQNNN